MKQAQVHSLLKKQLMRVASSTATEPLSKLVDLVNTVYEDNDRDRLRTERSMTLMIDELSEARAHRRDVREHPAGRHDD